MFRRGIRRLVIGPQAVERLGGLACVAALRIIVFVVFQHPEPVPDMGGMIFPDLRRDGEVGAAKGCSQW